MSTQWLIAILVAVAFTVLCLVGGRRGARAFFVVLAVTLVVSIGLASFQDTQNRDYLSVQDQYKRDHPGSEFDVKAQQLFPAFTAAKRGDTFRVERCISCHVPDLGAIGPEIGAQRLAQDFIKHEPNWEAIARANGMCPTDKTQPCTAADITHPAYVSAAGDRSLVDSSGKPIPFMDYCIYGVTGRGLLAQTNRNYVTYVDAVGLTHYVVVQKDNSVVDSTTPPPPPSPSAAASASPSAAASASPSAGTSASPSAAASASPSAGTSASPGAGTPPASAAPSPSGSAAGGASTSTALSSSCGGSTSGASAAPRSSPSPDSSSGNSGSGAGPGGGSTGQSQGNGSGGSTSSNGGNGGAAGAAPSGTPAPATLPGQLPEFLDPAQNGGKKLGIDQVGCVVCHNGQRLELTANAGFNSSGEPNKDAGAHTNLIVNPEYDFTAGAALYYRNCATCHGNMGEGVTGPPLSNQDRLGFFNEDYYYRCIEYGNTGFEHIGTLMPAWGSSAPDFQYDKTRDAKAAYPVMRQLQRDQIDVLIQFIRHWQQYETLP